MRISSQARQMVCYHCQQPGHMMRDCPPEAGIPGFWNSIVPVSNRTGEDTIRSSTARYSQRGHPQFQGATRAPHISQAGPRGQSMGRGKGRGPQVGTSGVQGRVYAVTP